MPAPCNGVKSELPLMVGAGETRVAEAEGVFLSLPPGTLRPAELPGGRRQGVLRVSNIMIRSETVILGVSSLGVSIVRMFCGELAGAGNCNPGGPGPCAVTVAIGATAGDATVSVGGRRTGGGCEFALGSPAAATVDAAGSIGAGGVAVPAGFGDVGKRGGVTPKSAEFCQPFGGAMTGGVDGGVQSSSLKHALEDGCAKAAGAAVGTTDAAAMAPGCRQDVFE